MRRQSIERLREERAQLHDAITGMSAHLELPGEVLADGRIVSGADD